MKIENIVAVGGGKHLKINLSSGDFTVTAMKFSTTVEQFHYEKGDTVDLAVKLDRNEYMGEVKVGLHIKDIKDSITDDEKCIDASRLFEKIMRGEEITNSEREKALPSRDDVAKVYRYIRKKKEVSLDAENLCYRLYDDGENMCKYLISIEALKELGLICIHSDNIYISDNHSKVELGSSTTLVKLGFQ